MSEIKLLPCPFCGGSARLGIARDHTGAKRYVYCAKCGASTFKKRIWQLVTWEQDAAADWNRRAGDSNE